MAESGQKNLLRAKRRIPGTYLEDHCFDAQQAAEKAIKAVMMSHSIVFPYVHDIAHLLSLLEKAGMDVPEPVRQASLLTEYASAARYPAAGKPVTEGDYAEACRCAEAVVRWVDECLRAPPGR